MNNELKHIFDDSTCLTKKQLKEYVSGAMTNEEAHAVQVHINCCPFCNDAVEGFFEQEEGALAGISSLNNDFLKDHFGLHNPQIHLNSLTTHAPANVRTFPRQKSQSQNIWRYLSIAAALLLLVGAIWYMRFAKTDTTEPTIASNEMTQQPQEMSGATTNDAGIQTSPHGTMAIKEDKSAETSTTDASVAKALPAQSMPSSPGEEPRSRDQVATVAAEPQQEEKEEKKGFFKSITEKAKQTVEDASTSLVMGTLKSPEKSKYETSARNQQNDEQRAVPKDAQDEAAVARQYKIPVADKPAAKVVAEEESENTTQRYAGNMANTRAAAPQREGEVKISGARSESDAYILDGVQVKKSKVKKTEDTKPDHIAQANQLYANRKYGDALNTYRKEMQSDHRGIRQTAAVGAAKCYAAMGNKNKAKEILQSIVNEGGPQKREAKRLLNDLEKPE